MWGGRRIYISMELWMWINNSIQKIRGVEIIMFSDVHSFQSIHHFIFVFRNVHHEFGGWCKYDIDGWMYVLPLLMSKLSKQMDHMAMFPYFPYEIDKPMSKLVGGLALSTWCRPSTASRSLMRRRMRALRLGQPGDFRVMKWGSLATKGLNLRLPLLKKNIACFCWSGCSSHAMVNISVWFLMSLFGNKNLRWFTGVCYSD